MRRFPPVPRTLVVRLLTGTFVAVALAFTTISAQIPGRNVNMVAGNKWPDGDPFLQRQNEPSIAASTRNPLHLLGGANDYRTVDLPGLDGDEIGDAWLGLFKSFDGGQRWKSTLLPGYPQDTSAIGKTSPIHGYGAAADPVVRAGTSGMMYYAGLVFDRANPATPEIPGKSAIFVARYVDNNNQEAGDTFHYLGTKVLQNEKGGKQGDFLDKPWMAVDIPRDNARCTIVTPGEKGPITQSIPAGPVYVVYTRRSTDNKGTRYDVMFTKSSDCGATFKPPIKLNAENDRANQGATLAIDPKTGNVLVAWRRFDVSPTGNGDAVMTTKYTLSTNKFNTPGISRRYPNGKKKGLNVTKFFQRGGVSEALAAVDLATFDQATSDIHNFLAFRTNAYPTMAADETGRFYMAWAERGFDPVSNDPVNGDARVLVSTSTDGSTWTDPQAVSIEQQRGHQLMPSLTYAGGRLMLIFYDLRETRAQVFSKFIDDKTAIATQAANGVRFGEKKRHTIDLRAVMASPGATPVWGPSVRVSDYVMGAEPGTGKIDKIQLQINPPNLPMFKLGTAPFMGDYVDVAPAPTMVQDASGRWIYNTAAGSTPPVFHAVWTDNRDVRAPTNDANGDGNPWNDYTPPSFTGFSPMDPSRTVPTCLAGNAGSRNQNIYTARITGGLIVGSPGNTKQLGYRLDASGAPTTQLMQRSFVVFVQNTTNDPLVLTRTFRLTINNQPPGGKASFDQFATAPLTVIEAEVPSLSTASRTVYVTSSNPDAKIDVSVAELTAQGGEVKSGGLTGAVVLNPDIDNPDIDNPDIDNPDIDNPDIDNAEVSNPDIDNPDIDNPDIDNPDIDNPDIDNPDIDNIVIANPDIDNPDIDNPDIDNPDIDNPDIDNPDIDNTNLKDASLTDLTWAITNKGNTTSAYNVNLFFAQTTVKPGLQTQLILSRTYKTPVVQDCYLKSETRNVLVANVPDPHLVKASAGTVSDPNDPDPENATLWLAPGESARITLRIFDTNIHDNVEVKDENGVVLGTIDAAFVPNEDVTPVVQQQSVDTEDVDEGITEAPIVVQFPAPQAVDDQVSTAELTPVRINVLANDSTAYGSTKVISLHPAGMATHSGGGPGDIAFQPSTGFVYTQRGVVDPQTNALVGRVGAPVAQGGVISQVANPRTGINYSRVNNVVGGITTAILGALDARPDSPTFHQYLPMPVLTNSVLALGLDAPNGRLYVGHAPATSSPATPTTISVIDVNPQSQAFHTKIGEVTLPLGIRPQSIAVNTRTRKVYVATSNNQGTVPTMGGVYVFDGANPAAAVRVNNTFSAWSIGVHEASNFVFATANTQVNGINTLVILSIDGSTLNMQQVTTAVPMRFSTADERLVIHNSTGKVFIRMESSVVIFDGQRGSPSRGSVLATLAVGVDNNQADIAIDQELGLVVTVGAADYRADIVSVSANALAGTIPLFLAPTDVTIDPISHEVYIASGLTSVAEYNLATMTAGSTIPVFIESGGVTLNPVTNKGYAGIFSTSSSLGVVSGSGFERVMAGVNPASRLVYSARHDATKRIFIVSQGNQAGTGASPGGVLVIDGNTDTIEARLNTPPNPFGIGIDQVTGRLFVASPPFNGANGAITIFNANTIAAAGVNATLAPGFPQATPVGAIGFTRNIEVNPTTQRAYALVTGASPASVAVIDPVTNIITPLDGKAGTPLFDAAAAAGEAWGRASLVRYHAGLNKIYVAMFDSASNVTRIVSLDGATHVVDDVVVAGAHSNRHAPSFVIVNEAAQRIYVSNFGTDSVSVLDAATLATITTRSGLAGGPSAMAHNVTANRLYISSIDDKVLTALDGTTLEVLSTVRMPLVAYFLYVDEDESRLYTSGGDSMDESGVMIVTDVLGQLGTNVSVSSVGSAFNGTVVLNADFSVTYTPNHLFAGTDSFSYTITAPTGTAIGKVVVNVAESNPVAVAFGDGYNTASGQLLSVAAPGPLANDATGSSTIVTMVVDDTPDFGVLTPQPDGSFTYLPNPDFSGMDSFTYHAVTNALGASNEVTVTITVTNAAGLVVTNTADSGEGSLRLALQTAQFEPNSTITFNISGAGPHVIAPQTALPTITQPTTIDGYTQPGSSLNTEPTGGLDSVIKIQLNGQNLGAGANGLLITGGNSTIRGLAIGNFSGTGILMDVLGNNRIEGNYLGADASGLIAMPNGAPPTPTSNNNASGSGVQSRSPINFIGGGSPAQRNLISGNHNAGVRVDRNSAGGGSSGTGTVIKGNLVGTNKTGNIALANGPAGFTTGSGIQVLVPSVTIGGTSIGDRNVVSGNNGTGINAFSQTTGASPVTVVATPSALTVQGNYVGVRADGTGVLPNMGNGINATGASTVIGGTAGTSPGGVCTGACNVIAGNTASGINLGTSRDDAALAVTSTASNSIVEGNFIGVGPDGLTAMGNSTGISVTASGVRIGGASANQRNIISGNSGNGISASASVVITTPQAPALPFATVLSEAGNLVIKGNYVGVGRDGATPVGNGRLVQGIPSGGGMFLNAPAPRVGGTIAGEGNVVSGNIGTGISLGSHFENTQSAPFPAYHGQKYSEATGGWVFGNLVGTDASGMTAVPNAGSGVQVSAADAEIGTDVGTGRNVISGNASNGITVHANYLNATSALISTGTGAKIFNNFIGVNAAGMAALPNTFSGVSVNAPFVTIGGPGGKRNVISGNSGSGISATAARTNANVVVARSENLLVEHNYIGTNVTGLAAIANTGNGMFISGANSVIQNNLVAGNTNAAQQTATGISIGVHFENTNAPLGTIYQSPNGTQVFGNTVGLSVIGAALPNDYGIFVGGPGVTVGGSLPAQRNVVSGNNRLGISIGNNYVTATNTRVSSATGSVFRGNYVGLSMDGMTIIANNQGGIHSSANGVTIGGANAGDGNFVVGSATNSAIGLFRHTNGAALINAGGSSFVQGNVVGLAADLTTRLNAAGPLLNVNSAGNQILGNIIAGNGSQGNLSTAISVSGSASAPANGNTIRGNFIGTTPAGAAGLHNYGTGISVNNASGTQIGGQGATDGNTIVGGGSAGISISASAGESANSTGIVGNRIGIMPDGQTAQAGANAITTGINLTSNGGAIVGTVIGGRFAGQRNIIGGNASNGIALYNSGVTGSAIAGNYIGVAADGATPRGNGAAGIWISGSSDNTIGGTDPADANVIANNGQAGVGINNNGVRNRIERNSIYSNTGMGIDLDGNNAIEINDQGDGDSGANNRQNYPVLSGVDNSGATTVVAVDLSSFAINSYTVQVFANAFCDGSHGEGQRFVGTGTVTQPGGQVTLNELVPLNEVLTAVAIDPNGLNNGNTSEFSACLPMTGNPLSVTNTNDSGFGSLRNAIAYANATPGSQNITFNIPGVDGNNPAVISLQTPLPVITGPVTINGFSQPGYPNDGKPVIEITDGASIPNGLETGTDIVGVTIMGMAITGFNNAGIMLMQNDTAAVGNLVMQNYLGTDRFGTPGKGNATGIKVRSDHSNIGTNVIAGNTGTGLLIENDADNVQVLTNTIGLVNGKKLGNGNDGIAMFGSLNNNLLSGNVIAGNAGWGINLQDLANDHVTGTVMYGNTVGMDGNGNALDAVNVPLGNSVGGIRLNNAPATQVGSPSQARNAIGNNGGVGIHVLATPNGPGPVIRNNFIGLSTTGVVGRSNHHSGIQLDGPATVGGSGANEGNYISGNSTGSAAGIVVSGNAGGSTIRGNTIGLNVNGAMVPNGFAGIIVHAWSPITIGGSKVAGEGNVISGNGTYGIQIAKYAPADPFPSGTIIRGNRIGTNLAESLDLGNGAGVAGAGINVAGVNVQVGGIGVGEDNVIWYNEGSGIRVDPAVTGVRFERNSIWANAGLGIDLGGDGFTANDASPDSDTGANNKQNYPVLSAATAVGGPPTRVTFDTTSFASGTYQLNFYVTNACGATGKTWEGVTTTGQNIVGTFNLNTAVPSGYFITATATDAGGNTSEFSPCTEVDAPGVVTNTNDSGPGSLRAAVDYANNTPGAQTVTFSISGVNAGNPAVINLQSTLQLFAGSSIDAGSQPGYDNQPVIEVRDGNNVATGLSVVGSNVTIRGLAVTAFNEGIIVSGGLSSVLIEHNIIGSNRLYVAGLGNGQGIQFSASNSTIRNNAIVRNVEGLIVINGASNNVIINNGVGVSANGLAVHGNTWNGVVLYNGANDNRFESNVIAGNQGWGVDMQHSGNLAQVSGTKFWSNRIGLDASGNAVPNALGGIHILNAPGTEVGNPTHINFISGNNGPGLMIEGGNVSPIVQVVSNFIGLDPSGNLDRGNQADGIYIGQATDTLVYANVISGNNGNGVRVSGSNPIPEAVIRANIIGLNAAGNTAVPNDASGIMLTSAAADIGGTTVNDRNIISGNLRGITVNNSGANFTTLIRGNYIGVGTNGVQAIGNTQHGILVDDAPFTRIGDWNGGNLIANNGGSGVVILGTGPSVRVETNAIESNGGLGIDIGANGVSPNDYPDTNGYPNFPVISNANNTTGPTTYVTLDTTVMTAGTYLVEFFKSENCDASGYGEGGTSLIRFGITAQTGMAQLNLNSVVPAGWSVTALATADATGRTSEFSACARVTGGSTISGTVQYSTTPLENVNMDLIPGNVNNAPIQSTGSGPGGQYTFNTVPNGTYWIKSYGPDASYIGWSAVQVIVNNGNVSRNITLAKKMTLVSPAHLSTGITAKPNLTWNSLPEAAKYVIQINHNNTWQQIDPGAESLTNAYQVQTLLTGSETYKWQVDAYDSGNRHVGSTDMAFQFTVVAPIVVTVQATSGGQDNPNCCNGGYNTGTPATVGAILANGEKVWISATGGINWYWNTNDFATPNGVAFLADNLSLVPNQPAIALFARINGGPWQLIGTGPTMMQAIGNGVQLQLAVNDSDYADNAGSWTITIQK